MDRLNFSANEAGGEGEPPPAGTDFGGLLWRRKGSVLFGLLVGLAGGAAYLHYAPHRYTVSARLLVSPQAVPTSLDEEPVGSGRFLATQAEILRSPAVLGPVVETLERTDPPLASTPAPPIFAAAARLLHDCLPASSTPPRDPVHEALESLTVKPAGAAEVLTIGYTGEAEPRALRMVESLIASYRGYLHKMEQGSQLESLRLIREYEFGLRRDLEGLGKKYEELRRNHVSSERSDEALQQHRARLAQYGEQILAARLRRREMERLVQPAARKWLAELDAKERELAELYRQEFQQLKQSGDFQAKEQQLQAALARTQAMHDSVVGQMRQLQLVDQSLVAGRMRVAVRVLEPPTVTAAGAALPPPFALGLGAAVGLMLGGGWALLREARSGHAESPRKTFSQLGLPIAAAIPSIKTPRRTRDRHGYRALITCHAPESPAADAVRALRTRLLHAAAPRAGCTLLVTSAIQGEGKSTVAANLACSWAQLGKPVLLIDADLRNGVLDRVFDVPNATGLAAVLSGDASLAAAIFRAPHAPLDVLPCGPPVRNPAELVAAAEFPRILAELRRKYELVVLDGPPLLLDPAGLVLAAQADVRLLSVRVGHSTLEDARAALELLEEIHKPPWGVVLSAAPCERRDRRPYISRRPLPSINGKAGRTAVA